MAPIPPYTIDGILPPYIGAEPGGPQADMSPYDASLVEVIDRFATSPERVAIASGFLRYRTDLRINGVTDGFQWVDGSFLEDVENARGRPPKDIDIVTFIESNQTVAFNRLATTNPELIKKSLSKNAYKCDVHFVPLGYPAAWVISQTRYFVLLFSHQRETELWKGLLRVSLDAAEDAAAAEMLASRTVT